METSTIVNLAITGLVALFVIVGMYWGLVRGLRRTAIRGVWLAVTAGILILFLSSVVTNAIVNAEITITIDGQTFNGFAEVITYYVENSQADLSALGDSIDVVVKTLMTYVSVLLNSIIFVVLFWLLKILLLPLNWALSKWVFIGKKERQYRKDLKAYKKYIKQCKKANRGKKVVEVMGFAVDDEDKKLVESDLQELSEKKSGKKANLDSLHKARLAFDSMVMNMEVQKNQASTQDEDAEHNELLDKPYVEKVEEVEDVPVEEEYVPKEEYKPEEKEEKAEELKPIAKPKKPSRHRFLGMLLGGVIGLFVSAITISPAIGILNLAQDINNENEITLEDNSKQGVIDYITQGMFSEINNYYRDSIGGNALKYTGNEWIATETFKALTRTNIEGVNVNFSKDAVAIVSIMNEINIISNNITKAQENNYNITTLNAVLNSAEKVIDYLFDISIVDLLTPHLIEIAVDILKQQVTNDQIALRLAENNNQDTTTEQMKLDTDKLILRIADGLDKVDNTANLKKELKSIIKVLNHLNSGVAIQKDGVSGTETIQTSILSEVLKQSNGVSNVNLFTVVQKVNYDYFRINNKYYFSQLLNSVYAYEEYTPLVVTSIMPTTMDFLFKTILSELKVSGLNVSFDNITDVALKTMLVDIFDESFAILYHLNTIEKDLQGNPVFNELNETTTNNLELSDINISILTSVGKIIDSLTTPFTSEEYSNLMGELATSITDSIMPMLESIMSTERIDVLSGNIKNAMLSITKDEGVEREFETFGILFNYLIAGETIIDKTTNAPIIVEPLISGTYKLGDSNNWKFEITNLSAIGDVLNTLQDLKMFSYLPDSSTGITINNATYLFDSVLDKLIKDTEANIDETSLTQLTSYGYIDDNKIDSIDKILWNALTRMRKNLLDNVNTATGAFDWKESLSGQTNFFNFVEMVIEEMGESSTELFDFTSNNSILNKLVQDKYVYTDSTSSMAQKKSVLDEISQSPLLLNVVRNIILNGKSYLINSLPSDIEFKTGIEKLINDLLTTLGKAETTNNTYYSYLLNLNRAIDFANENELIKDGSFNLTIDDVNSIAKLGEMLDILTTPETKESAILSNSTVVEVLQELIDSMLLKDSSSGAEVQTKLAENIGDEKIYKPIEVMVYSLRNNLADEDHPIYENNSWKNIFSAFVKVANTDFTQMGTTKDALTMMGEVLDILSGREFRLNETDTNTISTPFISDEDAKKCIIGLVANNMSATEDEEIAKILFAVRTSTNISKLDAMAIKVPVTQGSETLEGVFTHYNKGATSNFAGALENIYTMSVGSWKDFCAKLGEDIDSFSLLDGELGRFGAVREVLADKTLYYTYYSEHDDYGISFAGQNGIERTITTVITGNYAIITIDHIKYLLKSKIREFNESYDAGKQYIKTIISELNTNVDLITAGNLDYEIKAVKYFMDFTSDLNTTATNIGVYMDEISNSVLLGNKNEPPYKNIGEIVAKALIEEVTGNIVIEPTIAGDVNDKLNEILGSDTQYLKEDNGSYIIDTESASALKEYIENAYKNEDGTAVDINTDVFDKFNKIQDYLNGLNL